MGGLDSDFKDSLAVWERNRKSYTSTRNHCVGLLKTFFFWAIREGCYRRENPMKQVKPYVVDIKRREYSDDEIIRIIAAAKQVEQEVAPNADILLCAERIVILLLLTGMRQGELLSLRWDNVRRDRIVIQRTETKQKKEKVIPITEKLKRTWPA